MKTNNDSIRNNVLKVLLILIGAILTSVLFCPKLGSGFPGNPKLPTVDLVNRVAFACIRYKEVYGENPNTHKDIPLSKILTGENKNHILFITFKRKNINSKNEIIDSWGTPLHISFNEAGVLIISAGPDKIFQSIDDISSDK